MTFDLIKFVCHQFSTTAVSDDHDHNWLFSFFLSVSSSFSYLFVKSFWLISSSSTCAFIRLFFFLFLHSHVFFFFFLFALEDRSLISLCYALALSLVFTITSVGSFNRTCRHAMNVVPSVHTHKNSIYIYIYMLRTYNIKFSSFVFEWKKHNFIALNLILWWRWEYIYLCIILDKMMTTTKKVMTMLKGGQINQEYSSIFH